MAELAKREPVMPMREQYAAAYEAAENQTPVFNATGDEATYILDLQPYQGPRGRKGPDSMSLDERQVTLTFIKINGKWYKKSIGDPNALPPPPPPPRPPPSGLPTTRGF
jgi:hypothetical protein